jgi:hypothetical protein
MGTRLPMKMRLLLKAHFTIQPVEIGRKDVGIQTSCSERRGAGCATLDSGGFFAPDHDGNSIPAWSSEIRLLFAHSAIFLYFSVTF